MKLHWPDCFNARDLGGLRTADGRTVRTGALVRSDTLCRLNADGARALVAHGVRTVIDVRGGAEIELDPPHPFRGREPGPAVPLIVHAPIEHGRTDEQRALLAEALTARKITRADLNLAELDGSRRGIAEIARRIARAPEGGVLVHCHAGKDRTGLVVAVVLAFLGVPDEAIAEDYALSHENLEPLAREWLDRMSNDPVERDRLMETARPTPEAMLVTLARLRDHHGGAEAYLRAGGATDEDLLLLRERLLD